MTLVSNLVGECLKLVPKALFTFAKFYKSKQSILFQTSQFECLSLVRVYIFKFKTLMVQIYAAALRSVLIPSVPSNGQVLPVYDLKS